MKEHILTVRIRASSTPRTTARLIGCVAAEIASFTEGHAELPTQGRHEHTHVHVAEWTLTEVKRVPGRRLRNRPPTCDRGIFDYKAKYEAIVVRCRNSKGRCFCGAHITPVDDDWNNPPTQGHKP